MPGQAGWAAAIAVAASCTVPRTVPGHDRQLNMLEHQDCLRQTRTRQDTQNMQSVLFGL
jgi:hypothetical protein